MNVTWLPLVLILASLPTASGAVIDLFADSPQEISSSSAFGSEHLGTSPAEISGSLFSSRELRIQYGAQSLAVDTTVGELRYEVTGEESPENDSGYFDVIYRSPDPVDLLADGANAFEIRFASLSPSDYLRVVGFGVNFGSDVRGGALEFERLRSVSGDRLVVPFSRFQEEVDLSQVTSLSFTSIRLPLGTSFSVAGIRTIPEPSVLTSVFATMGLFVLRRKRDPLR